MAICTIWKVFNPIDTTTQLMSRSLSPVRGWRMTVCGSRLSASCAVAEEVCYLKAIRRELHPTYACRVMLFTSKIENSIVVELSVYIFYDSRSQTESPSEQIAHIRRRCKFFGTSPATSCAGTTTLIYIQMAILLVRTHIEQA